LLEVQVSGRVALAQRKTGERRVNFFISLVTADQRVGGVRDDPESALGGIIGAITLTRAKPISLGFVTLQSSSSATW
jgi:hypothetical protein